MTLTFLTTLVLVTVGALLAGHTLVRWARRKGDAIEHTTALAVSAATVSEGLALQAQGAFAAGLQLSGLALIAVALLALVRRRSRSLS
jgi:multisubunit Na+/H+ antiporter MnhB subunit